MCIVGDTAEPLSSSHSILVAMRAWNTPSKAKLESQLATGRGTWVLRTHGGKRVETLQMAGLTFSFLSFFSPLGGEGTLGHSSRQLGSRGKI